MYARFTSVISSSSRSDGLSVRMMSYTWASKQYRPTTAYRLGGSPEGGGGPARLLGDVHDAALVVEHRYAEALGVRHLLEEDAGARLLVLHEVADGLRLGVLEDVVAEADDQFVAGGEALGHRHHRGDAAGLPLHLVGEVQVEQWV